jgi:hypothetical protein
MDGFKLERVFKEIIHNACGDIQLFLAGAQALNQNNLGLVSEYTVTCIIIHQGNRCFEISLSYSLYDGFSGRNGFQFGDSYSFSDNNLKNMEMYREQVDEIIRAGSAVFSFSG